MPHAFHSRAYKHLLELLVEARRSAGLTQTELGNWLGRRQTFVSKVEQGERRLDLVELIVWCELLETDIHELIRKVNARITERRI